jgi:hypothetical protein
VALTCGPSCFPYFADLSTIIPVCPARIPGPVSWPHTFKRPEHLELPKLTESPTSAQSQLSHMYQAKTGRELNSHLGLLDALRGVAILSVFLYHCLGASFGFDQLSWNGLLPDFHVSASFLVLLPCFYGWAGGRPLLCDQRFLYPPKSRSRA